MFESSTLFGVLEDGTIKKFLMESSIDKLRRHFSSLYARYHGYESSAYVFGYNNNHEEMSFVEFEMDSAIMNAITDASPIEKLTVDDEEWLNIQFIFMGEHIRQNKKDMTHIVFQRIQKSQIIGRKNGVHLFPNKNTLAVFENSMLSIPFRLECYFADGKLFFNSVWHARQIFDMHPYVKEATDGDVADFAKSALFTNCNSDELVGIADEQMRSKITTILASGATKKYSAKKIQSVARKIGFDLKTKQIGGKGRIVMPEDKKEIKTFLKILAETIFEGMLSGELKESNSSKPFKQ